MSEPPHWTYLVNVSRSQGFLDRLHTRPDVCHCLALTAYFVAVVVIVWLGGG